MKFQMDPARQDELHRIELFFEGQHANHRAGVEEIISWMKIEDETQVKMTQAGRRLVYQALRKLRFPYRARTGYGIELSSPDNACGIMTSAAGRIRSSLDRAVTTNERLAELHLPQMTRTDQQRLTTVGAFLGSVKAVLLGDRVLKA